MSASPVPYATTPIKSEAPTTSALARIEHTVRLNALSTAVRPYLHHLPHRDDRVNLDGCCNEGNRVDMNQLDVTFDTQDELWRCCSTNSDGTSNCSHPTDETFSAPPPNSLSTIYPITSSSSSSSPPSISSSSSTSSSLAQAAADSSTTSATATIILPTSTAQSPTTMALPTESVGNNGNNTRGQGLDTSVKLAIILATVIGLPGTIGTIVGAWFAYLAARKRRVRSGP